MWNAYCSFFMLFCLTFARPVLTCIWHGAAELENGETGVVNIYGVELPNPRCCKCDIKWMILNRGVGLNFKKICYFLWPREKLNIIYFFICQYLAVNNFTVQRFGYLTTTYTCANRLLCAVDELGKLVEFSKFQSELNLKYS